MKQSSLLLVLICLLQASRITAQSSAKKPLQFKQCPAIIRCSAVQFDDLFNKKLGEKPVINLDGNLQLKGIITKSISKYNNDLQTVVIQLPEFNNSIFSISRRMENNTAVYIGHLYNGNFADGYQLKKAKNNEYEMVKISSEKVLQPCSY